MNIYVGNISPRVSEAELHLIFEGQGLGRILFIQEADPDVTQSKGYAIVELETEEQLRVATTVLNGKKLKNQTLIIRRIDEHNWNHMVMSEQYHAFNQLTTH